MANRLRPRCPGCGAAMSPVYRKNQRDGMTRIPDIFYCTQDSKLARGRRNSKML